MAKKAILTIDTNLGLSHALALGRADEKVYYSVAGISAYPNIEENISGYGFKEIIKENDWAKVVKDCDTIIFLDSGYGSLVDTFREAKYNVWGSPAIVEQLEFDRIYFREVMKKLGIKTVDAEVVHGIDEVIDYLKKNKGKFYIKLNKYRGNVETFGTDSVGEAVTLLYPSFPVMGDELDFIIEKESEGIEIGADCFFNGKRFLKKYFFTFEKKGEGTMGVIVENSVLDEFLQKITPYLAENNYHGSFCFEGFWDGKEFKPTDITPRIPYPCSSSWILAIKNYNEFMRGVASGEIDDFEIHHPYQIQLAAFAEDSKRWRKMEINTKGLDGEHQSIEFRKAVLIDKEYYYVPNDDLMVTCNGAGDNWEETLKNSDECTNKIKAYSCSVDGGVQMYFKDTIENLKKYNIELIPATNKKEKAELTLSEKIEEIEAKLKTIERVNKPDITFYSDDFCKCETPEINTEKICAKCGKKLFAETNPGIVLDKPGIPHPKETPNIVQ